MSVRRRALPVLATVLLLAGCAAPASREPGAQARSSDVAHDLDMCERAVSAQMATAGTDEPSVRVRLLKACLDVMGWEATTRR